MARTINCTPELATTGSQASGREDGNSRATAGSQPAPPNATEEPPKAAAGFTFGTGIAAIKQACEGAGKSWTIHGEEHGTCSGPAMDVGFEATVRIDFCYKQSCVITLEQRPPVNWLSALNELKAALSRKYGKSPSNVSDKIPENCRTEDKFVKCLSAEELRVKYAWTWPTRQQIVLTAGKPEQGDGDVAIRVTYVTPPTGGRPKAEAL